MSGEFFDLLGIHPSEFFSTFWMKQPVVLQPSRVDLLFAVGRDTVLEWYVKHAVTDRRFATYNVGDHSRNSGRTRLEAVLSEQSRPLKALLTDLLQREAFIIRDMADLPGFDQFCRRIAEFCRARISLNCYMVNPGADHFPIHQDGHHIFAIQSMGQKEWSFWPPTVELPLSRYRWHKEPMDPAPPLTLRASAGQIVYIPTGWRHIAEPVGGTSIHFSLGLHPLRWVELLRDICEHSGSRHVSLRDYVPFSVGPQGFKYVADIESAKQLLAIVTSEAEASLEMILDHHNHKSVPKTTD